MSVDGRVRVDGPVPIDGRLQQAAYTSPSGSRHVFDYEDVSSSTPKRTTAFDFPGVNRSYVQDSGHGSGVFPMRCIFSGDSADLLAQAFRSALLERGPGHLQHPLYGSFVAIPFGDIEQQDDLVSGVNQSVVQTTFWETLPSPYPMPQAPSSSDVLATLDASKEAAAGQFAEQIDVSTTASRAVTATRITGFIELVSSVMGGASGALHAVSDSFTDARDAIGGSIDLLVGRPLSLARHVLDLLRLPASIPLTLRARLEAYAEVARAIELSQAAQPWRALTTPTPLRSRQRAIANDFHCSVLLTHAALCGAAQCAVTAELRSRPEALGAAAFLLRQLETASAWMDAGYAALEAVAIAYADTGQAYRAVHAMITVACRYLIDASFSLLPERRITTDRARTIVDLCAELYGRVDSDALDELIATNDLSGAEILELPKGRELVYYG